MRTRIGAGILILLLALGIWVTRYTARTQTRVSGFLVQAREAAEEDRWDRAEALYLQALHCWQAHRRPTAALVDHAPIEQAESLFSRLAVYLRRRDPGAFCSCCAALEAAVRAIGEAHSISWWNLL